MKGSEEPYTKSTKFTKEEKNSFCLSELEGITKEVCGAKHLRTDKLVYGGV